MMTLIENLCEQGFHQEESFLPLTDCQALRAMAEAKAASFKKAGIGLNVQQNNTIRGDRILWLPEGSHPPALEHFLHRIHDWLMLFNRTLFLNLKDIECHFAIYSPGTFYKKHIDQFAQQKNRQLSFVYYLNPDWTKTDGGALRFYDTAGHPQHELLPLENRLICFKSDIPHEVLLTHKTRYSLTGWMKTQ